MPPPTPLVTGPPDVPNGGTEKLKVIETNDISIDCCIPFLLYTSSALCPDMIKPRQGKTYLLV